MASIHKLMLHKCSKCGYIIFESIMPIHLDVHTKYAELPDLLVDNNTSQEITLESLKNIWPLVESKNTTVDTMDEPSYHTFADTLKAVVFVSLCVCT